MQTVFNIRTTGPGLHEFTAGRPALGTWQQICLFEHCERAHARRVVVHLGT